MHPRRDPNGRLEIRRDVTFMNRLVVRCSITDERQTGRPLQSFLWCGVLRQQPPCSIRTVGGPAHCPHDWPGGMNSAALRSADRRWHVSPTTGSPSFRHRACATPMLTVKTPERSLAAATSPGFRFGELIPPRRLLPIRHVRLSPLAVLRSTIHRPLTMGMARLRLPPQQRGDRLKHRGILDRAGHRLVTPVSDAAHGATQDLARAGLRQGRHDHDLLHRRDRPDRGAD
jgi:hypothetical protein